MNEQWLSIVEYARTFNTSDMTIRRRIKSGRIRAQLREGKYFIPVPMSSTGQLLPISGTVNTNIPAATVPVNSNSTHAQVNNVVPQPASVFSEQRGNLPPVKSTNVGLGAMAGAITPATARPNLPSVGAVPGTEIGFLVATIQQMSLTLEKTHSEVRNLNESNRLLVQKFHDVEQHFKNELATQVELRAELTKTKDLQIRELQQQIEDLKLLVQILEKKSSIQRT